MLIYFAGPLFSEAEKKFNQSLAEKLESAGFDVFLPQRDGVEKSKPPYKTMTEEKIRTLTFNLDKEKIIEADIFLFILDGRVPDEGACVELGLAYGQKMWLKKKKFLIGLQTDTRSAFLGAKLNPMLKVPFDFIANDEKELFDKIKTLWRANKEKT